MNRASHRGLAAGVCVMLVVSLQAPVQAQDGFRPGARIEGRFGGDWEKCTVVEHKPTGGYIARCDKRPADETTFAASDVRALQGADPGGGANAVAQAKTMIAAATAQCQGEPVINPQTKGQRASGALFATVLRSMFDAAPSGGMHKKVTKVSRLEVGKPYHWEPGTDGQRLGQAKTVYPVKTTFAVCDDGPFNWAVAEYVDYEYSCRVDESRSGAWSCGLHTMGVIRSSSVNKQANNNMVVGR